MAKDKYFNLFDLYSKIIKYNIDSLNRLLEINKSLFERINLRDTTREQIKITNKDNDETELEEVTQKSFQSAQQPGDYPNGQFTLLNALDDDIQALGETNIALMSNRPIKTLGNISEDNYEKLNLFGIHSIADLIENDLTKISQNTGISKKELNDWTHQAKQYLP